MIKPTCLMLLFAMTFNAHAAKERGGGNALVCFNSTEAAEKVKLNAEDRALPEIERQVNLIEILDLAEAQAPRGASGEAFSVIQASANENVDAYVTRIARRFDGNIPLFAKFIRDGQSRFKQLYIQRSQKPIAPINDIGITRMDVDSKCVIMTMMEQRIQNGREVMWIDQWLLNHPKQSATSKAVAFLHEYIYAEARAKLNHETSESTREAVGLAILKNSGLNVLEIQKQLSALGFLIPTKERLWKNESEVTQYVLDQKILSNGLTVSEPFTMAHKQVEQTFRQWALAINHAVNDSAIANAYRQKIFDLYSQKKVDYTSDKYLSPVLGSCRVTGTKASAPIDLEPIDMASCSFVLLAYGDRPLYASGTHQKATTPFDQQRMNLYLDMTSALTQLGNQEAQKLAPQLKDSFRPLLQKIEGASPETIEAFLQQIVDSFRLRSYSHPASYLPEENGGKLTYRGPVAYISAISHQVNVILHTSDYALLQHLLPIF